MARPFGYYLTRGIIGLLLLTIGWFLLQPGVLGETLATMGGLELIVIMFWLLCGLVSGWIAQSRGASNMGAWFLIGVLLGPIGILLAAVLVKGTPAPGVVSSASVETLERLAKLRADGHISDDEYETKKTELLARL